MKLPPIAMAQPGGAAADSEQMARQLQAAYDAEAVADQVEDEDEEDDGARAGGRRNRRGKKGRRRKRDEGALAG